MQLTPDEQRLVLLLIETAVLPAQEMEDAWGLHHRIQLTRSEGMFDEQPDGDPHGECAAEITRLNAALAAERERRRGLEVALRLLYDETTDYIKLNHLSGMDNHCMQLARAALAQSKQPGAEA